MFKTEVFKQNTHRHVVDILERFFFITTKSLGKRAFLDSLLMAPSTNRSDGYVFPSGFPFVFLDWL